MSADPPSQLPSATPFLNSVCPGFPGLDDNVHYQLGELPRQCGEIPWPITTTNTVLRLDGSYLNVARPALNKNESTTYVSLPYHITSLFEKVVKNSEKGLEGYMHIGANINPLLHDPFKIVNFNPGCMTRIITLTKSRNPFADNRTFTNAANKSANFFKDLLRGDFKVLNDKKINNAAKLLVSTHVNILNVFALDERSQYVNTKKSKSKVAADEVQSKSYERLIEEPVLRIQFKEESIITAISTFVLNDEPIVVLGFHSGEIIIIKVLDSKFQTFGGVKKSDDDLEVHTVTSIEAIRHPNYEFLIVAGYSSGEVVFVNPSGLIGNYTKCTEEKDASCTYFKKFDLSPLGKVDNSFLLGHIKVSHKPITSISSTLPINKPLQSPESQPLILALASADGFVRFIDLIFTYNLNYGDKKSVIITDVLSNYFNTGITEIQFSPDFKFLCVVGNGDLIEVFKMSYYNVNGLLHKNTGRRSRSGTVNSANSSGEPRIKDARGGGKDLYPPLIKDIQIVGRFKGHSNVVKSIKFVKDNANSLVYKLISCGYDGKTFVWEFDYKALPKVKKHHAKPTSVPRESRPKSIHDRRQILVSPSPLSRMKHNRNKSIEDNPFHSSSLTNITNTNSMNMILQDEVPKASLSTDQIEVVVSLYKSLYDVRLKRHYKKKPIQQNIICPIVSDKLVPSIEIPLATIDLSVFVGDGKIDSFYIDESTFWCFAKNGDLFRYVID
ncbi:UBP9-binding protein bun62 [Candida viswanathii]|uniref:UBP9-binding protein bun62 n=1 Tax=Candida viswanathii TaxID=5486 RepID=A0A367YAU8_9ASCO|nr:UBP9-binding protein bun62 [Candida viswanathii]